MFSNKYEINLLHIIDPSSQIFTNLCKSSSICLSCQIDANKYKRRKMIVVPSRSIFSYFENSVLPDTVIPRQTFSGVF